MANILTVDDSPSVRQMIKILLAPAGHTVIEAGDGAQGLEQAKANRPDLVITDLNMPAMNGPIATHHGSILLDRVSGNAIPEQRAQMMTSPPG